ncbi:hypothetical protein AMELA_G00069650 [Ameiurus melas]|uniref:Uncharacterized protein n=1 Tax=Ameiurus melas TaxID=219545 RepID=A0A7J6B4B3_AMEME|nr:hypothetical protein AMELA_G00069650 [Ameiurus melas]
MSDLRVEMEKEQGQQRPQSFAVKIWDSCGHWKWRWTDRHSRSEEGFRSVGFELNPWLVWYSRYRAWKQGVHCHTSFYISDLWKVSFAQYSNVVIFGVPQMMEQLEAKLQTELQSSARVVACRFPFPTWTPDHVTGEGIDTVWVYDAKSFKSHTTTAKLLNHSEDENLL